MSWQQHPDHDVRQALIKLCDALCSWERNTGRQSLLIVRENNGELPGDPMREPGFCFRADCGKPLSSDQDDIPDSMLLDRFTVQSSESC
jgi:hypothetical protein